MHRQALTIDDDAAAEVLLAVLRGRCDDRSWNKLDDSPHAIATQLIAAGVAGTLAPSDHSRTPSIRASCSDSTGDPQPPDR